MTVASPPPSSYRPTSIIFPDLISPCPYPLRVNPHCQLASTESKRWLLQGCRLKKKKRAAFHGLRGGLLTAMCYPLADYEQLRVCCDFINYLFHLDNICDEMDDRRTVSTSSEIIGALRDPRGFRASSAVGRLTQSFWRRLTTTGSQGAQRRFIETFELFFRAVTQQAKDRASGNIPDLESYIAMRRDTSGCKPCWALIEYANNLDLPDWVMEHPVVLGLGEAANDLVTWSNDIFSYNVEQANGDTHNMIVIVQHHEKLELQEAIDYVGDLCLGCIDRFDALRKALPSWGPEIDEQLNVYIDGLSDWMIGNLVWSFETERYFGKEGPQVRRDLCVRLLPLRK
ncbi:terpenoid synthase [Dichomitus squalens]|uniref:Terpene synthase n=1 Tax=Dichomitus squalens TaxID=114155 RepID=A0A4Q9NFE6_9APHY|nr:terpenoid synthase [Dichomitus squalens]TBU39799.1 terpenoid synthase [Dichomitus squalens]TBU60351.1 terpenoid synthase [Dichomitus squalens]